MIAAHELDLIDRLELLRSVAAMSAPNPTIMAHNPLSKIPTLVLDDGAVIIDSRVILEYFDDLAGGGRLIPTQRPARWWALTNAALADGLLDLLILWRNEREKPRGERSLAWLEAFAFKAEATLDRSEEGAPTLEVQPFGVAHIGLGCALSYLDFRFDTLDWRARRPALAKWHAIFAARPSAAATKVVND
jgi:glutathione S-transferase